MIIDQTIEQHPRLRVVHVVRQFFPGVGGLENFVLSLAREQIAEGHKVDVVTLNRLTSHPERALPKLEKLENIVVHRIGYFGSSRYPIALGVLRHLRAADIVHVHGVDFFCDFLAVTRFWHRKPLVLSTHGGFFHTAFASSLKKAFFRTITPLSLAGYRRVFACSTNDFELFCKVKRRGLVLMNNGVDTIKFGAAASRSFKPSFLYFGRLASHKGLTELVDAFDGVCRQWEDATLHIAGDDWDGTRGALELHLAKQACRDRVHIHLKASDQDLRSLMGNCSFFVSASHYEGFGLAAVEAMSAGLIPITNNIKSFKTIIGAARSGILTDFSNRQKAVADMSQFLSEMTEEKYAILRNCVIAASNDYNWKSTAKHFDAEYAQMLGLPKRNICGVALDVKTRDEVVMAVDDAIDAGKQLKIAFANAHTLNLAATTPRFRQLLSDFLVLNDGIGVDIASWLSYGRAFKDNLNGTDFVPFYLNRTRHGLAIYLLGGPSDVVEAAVSRFGEAWPQHRIVGFHSGFFSNSEEEVQVGLDIRASNADIVLVGMGNPLQEYWIANFADRTGAKALIGVGALFDFVTNNVSRAPKWVRAVRCEWLFRLAQEPRRLWRRYIVGNAAFIARVLMTRGYY